MSKQISSLICVTALTVFSVGRASAVDLTAVETYPVGTNPVAIATGDLDNDGFLDLVVADWGSGDISVLLNKGNGNAKFKDAKFYPAGTNPHAVAVGDFNADGFLDLAVANTGGMVSILLNRGLANPGHFKPKTDIPAGNSPYAVGVADFNGDNILDLAVVNQAEGVSILLGNGSLSMGDGTFGAPTQTLLAGGHTSSLVAGLIDGDNKADLAVVDSSGPVYFLKGQGNGNFQAATTIATLPRPFAIAMDTLDGNNKPDLVITDYSSQVFVLLNQGSGVFNSSAYATGFVPSSVATGDFNFDLKKDLIVANSYSGTVRIWHGVGNGTFINPEDTSTGILSGFVAAGDFRNLGFGHTDVAVALFMFNQVSVLKGR
jgi:hypothetical protein